MQSRNLNIETFLSTVGVVMFQGVVNNHADTRRALHQHRGVNSFQCIFLSISHMVNLPRPLPAQPANKNNRKPEYKRCKLDAKIKDK